MRRKPVNICHWEFIDATGGVTPVPFEVKLKNPVSGEPARLPFLVTPEKSVKAGLNGISQVRLRLLFLPRGSGFSGSILSPLVRTK
jgi:hypothetical protein